jgi:hypothetical protein
MQIRFCQKKNTSVNGNGDRTRWKKWQERGAQFFHFQVIKKIL